MFWSRLPPVTYEYQSAIAHRVRDILTGADHTHHHKHLAGKENKKAIKALQRPEALAGVIDILRTMPEPAVEPMEDDDDSCSADNHGEGTSATSTSDLTSIRSEPLKEAKDKGKSKEKKKQVVVAEVAPASTSAPTLTSTPTTGPAISPSTNAVSTNGVSTNGVVTIKEDKKMSPEKVMMVAAAVTGTLAAATVVTTSVVKRPLFYPPTDIVSSQAFWWGYEVYIPEKALSRIAAAQDVSTAFLSFLSTVGLMVPAIVPFLGYIAAYVGLEFAVIKAQNEGRGVILASTWLLPVALVPRAWDIPDQEPEEETEKKEA